MTQALKCLFELMVYVVRFKNSEAQIPAWRNYPSINVARAIYKATQGDGDACADIAEYLFRAEDENIQHFDNFKSEDISYWLRKGLRHQSVKAATLMASLVLEHKSSLFSLDEVQNALRSLKASSSDQELNHLAGTIAERKGQMEQAIKHYQKAAEQGCHRSIKRLVEHFASKNDAVFSNFIAQGVKHREPISTVVDLVFTLATPEKVKAKSFKSAIISAKATSLPGFGFVEGLCYFNGYAGYTQDGERAAELMLRHYKKLPDFTEPAVLTFYVLLQMDKKSQLVSVAQEAMRQLSKANKTQELARLELDLAFVLIELCGTHRHVAFEQTPKSLLQSAAKKGLPEAISFLAQTQSRHLPKNTRATTKQQSTSGNWASRLVTKSCSSQRAAA
jgi:tetratricopeptide (TPR) repeat protein